MRHLHHPGAPPSSSRPLLPRRSYRFIARVRGSFETWEVFPPEKSKVALHRTAEIYDRYPKWAYLKGVFFRGVTLLSRWLFPFNWKICASQIGSSSQGSWVKRMKRHHSLFLCLRKCHADGFTWILSWCLTSLETGPENPMAHPLQLKTSSRAKREEILKNKTKGNGSKASGDPALHLVTHCQVAKRSRWKGSFAMETRDDKLTETRHSCASAFFGCPVLKTLLGSKVHYSQT